MPFFMFINAPILYLEENERKSLLLSTVTTVDIPRNTTPQTDQKTISTEPLKLFVVLDELDHRPKATFNWAIRVDSFHCKAKCLPPFLEHIYTLTLQANRSFQTIHWVSM